MADGLVIRGVILDLDGTLIDSMGVWYRLDREFLRENGIADPPADISERMKKMSIDESADYFVSHFGLSLTPLQVSERIREMVRYEYEKRICLKPYAKELLDRLDSLGIRYGVATATYSSLAEAVLKRCGVLDRMSFLLTDEQYPCGKNRPDIFEGAAILMGNVPCETLVVEDSLHCIQTASGAGFPVAAVYDEAAAAEREKIEAAADWYCASLREVADIIDEYGRY